MPVPENQSSHSGPYGHSHPAQATAEGTEHTWQAAQGTEAAALAAREAAFQHTHLHNTSRHTHQTSCRAGVMIPNTHEAGVS